MRNESARTGAAHAVGLVVIRDTPIFEAGLVCEVFGVERLDLVDPWYRFSVHPAEPDMPLAGGFFAPNAGTLADLASLDTIVVSGAATPETPVPQALLVALRAAAGRGTRIASICTGAFVLAEAGLLDGSTATTHWMHAADLAHRYPAVTVNADVLYAEEGNIWTSAGAAAGIDLCLELLRRDHGATVAGEVARRMVVPPHRFGGQAQYVRSPIPRKGERPEAELAQWARRHLADDLTVAKLAQHAGVSQRTLNRRFKTTAAMTPRQWLARERLTLAQELLETTDLPIERIALRCGLGTAANLRARFQQHLGVTPTAYRRTFTVTSDSSHSVDSA